MKLQIYFNILNMKKLILSASAMALLGAGALTSCSQEDVTQPNIVKSNEIGLSVAGIQTRVATDPQATALASGNFVGAFNVETSVQGKYEAGSNNTLSAVEALTGQPGATVNVVAYAPYNQGWKYEEPNTFTVNTNQSNSTGYVASDLVYAGSTPATVGETTALTFTHQLAQLKVNFITKGGVDLNNAEVTVTNVATSASIDLKTGIVTPATQGNASIQTLTGSNLGTSITAYSVIVPQTLAAGTKLVKISVGDIDYTASTSAAVRIESGNTYSFTVTVGVDDAELSLGDVTISRWAGDNTIEGGQVGADKYASFGTPETGANYENNTFSWEENGASVPMFEFTNSELADYKSLVMTFSGATRAGETNVKVMYHTVSTSGILKEYTTYGTKIIDLTQVANLNLSEVTKISLAGNSESGSIMISSNDVYLTRGEASGGDEEPEPKTEVTLQFSDNTATATVGEKFTPTLTVTPEEAKPHVKYTSSNAEVATVNESTGEVEILALGTTTITAKIENNETYVDATASYDINVNKEFLDLSTAKGTTTCKWNTSDNIFSWWEGSNNVITLFKIEEDQINTKYKTIWFTISELSKEDLSKTDAKGLRLYDTAGRCVVHEYSNGESQDVDQNIIIKNGTYFAEVEKIKTKDGFVTIQFGGLVVQNDGFKVQEKDAITLKLTDVYFSTENPLEQ